MYEKLVQEKGTLPISKPILFSIIEKLEEQLNRYENIAQEIKDKLQSIKRYDKIPTTPEPNKEDLGGSVTDRINSLLVRLEDLNELSATNLAHLREIV